MILSLALAGAVLAPMAFPDLIMGDPIESDDDQTPQPAKQVDHHMDFEYDSDDAWPEDDNETDMSAPIDPRMDTSIRTMAEMLQIDFDAIEEREGDLSVFDALTFMDTTEHPVVEAAMHKNLDQIQTVLDGFNKDEDLLVIEVPKGQAIALQHMAEVNGNTRFDFSDGKSVLLNGVTGVSANIVHFSEI